jgi:hypothetical protein
MNDFDLISKLKSVPVPVRPDEYWDDFPAQVRLELRRTRNQPVSRQALRSRLVWGCDAALAAALVVLCIQFHPWQSASDALARHQRYFHAQFARLDNGLHRLVLNTDGMGYLLAEAN